MWLCRCICGNLREVHSGSLVTGNTKSCGCRWRDNMVTHGDSKTLLYKTWAALKQRCNNPTHNSYKHYGKRGITFYAEWKKYLPFKEWALDNGYHEGLSIDRIDNNGNYEPDNCQWITRSENSKKGWELQREKDKMLAFFVYLFMHLRFGGTNKSI